MSEEIKSALERALERAERLGKLSPEEMRRQREAELLPIGEALAQRYLEHGQLRVLEEQLERYQGDDRAPVLRGAIRALARAITLTDKPLAERAVEGISALTEDKQIQHLAEEVLRLFGRRAWEEKLHGEEVREEVERELLSRLARAGISGSAVAEVNLRASPSWREHVARMEARFLEELETIKAALMERAG